MNELFSSFLVELLWLDAPQWIVLVLLSISASLIGVWLVLRKMAMLANSISHTVLLGVVAAWLIERALGSQLAPSFFVLAPCAACVAALTILSTHLFQRVFKVSEDASIGLVFSGLFALGVMSLSWTFPHSHVGIEIIMGNADAIDWEDILPVLASLALNLGLTALLYKEYELSTFDRALAQSMGFSSHWIDFLLMTQVTLTMMVGFRAVGSFLILALLIGPVLCARQLTHHLPKLIALATLIGGCAATLSVVIARLSLETTGIALSTAGLLTTLLLLGFLAIAVIQSLSAYWRRLALLPNHSGPFG